MQRPAAEEPTRVQGTRLAAEVEQPEARFDTPAVATVAGAHFVHDLYPAFVGPLLPLLIEKHGMSLAVAGGLATMLRLPSVAQPFLGYWADRYDARLMVVLPPLVTAGAISLLGLAPSYVALVALLLIAGVSSATFHPTAGAMVTRASGNEWGRATSYFMTGGELGRALGPIFIAAVVAAVGLGNTWIAVVPGVAITLLAYSHLAGRNARIARPAVPSGLRAAISTQGRALLLLSGVVFFRSLVISSFQVFFPTYLTRAGESLVYAGLALTIYEIGGVLGAFLGGQLSDRFGRRRMMLLSQVAAGPILFGALLLATQPIGLALLAVGGLLALCAGPVQLALVQELLPGNRSTATGIMMFLGFESQVVATIGMGVVAESIGLQSALGWSVLASMLSVPFTMLLPETRQARSP